MTDTRSSDLGVARAERRAGAERTVVAHVIHELSVGGLENGLVNLINQMPEQRFRHAIICMTRYDEDFRSRIRRTDVPVFAVNRDAGSLALAYWKLYRLFRELKPHIVHSRNLSGLDALIPGYLAGVPVRIHGEHGRDVDDLDGSNAKYRRLKRLLRPLVTQYTAVSPDLAQYLRDAIGVPADRVAQIFNGVDANKFHPPITSRAPEGGEGLRSEGDFVVGTVGRLQPVKDQLSLVKAFEHALRIAPQAMRNARLWIVGEGPSWPLLEQGIEQASLRDRAVLLGGRDDVDCILRSMDLFVLPSIGEGISNTILEAMATGLPVIATRVGGNAHLVDHGVTGVIVDPGDWAAMAQHIVSYALDAERRLREGRAGRARVERVFSLESMVHGYASLYESLVERSAGSKVKCAVDATS